MPAPYGIRNIELLFPYDTPSVAEPDPEPEPEPPVTESIFTDQIPASVDLEDNVYTLGTLFKADVDGDIVGIRVYVGGVPTSSPQGLLYAWLDNTTGTLLESKVFGTMLSDEWNEVLFDTPVAITANTVYVAAWGPSDNYSATTHFFDDADLVNGHLAALRSLGDRQNGKFHVGNVAAYPDGNFNSGCYFVDVLFVAST